MALPITYNVRNVRVRWQVTLLAVCGIALVVAVFAVLMSMAEGFRRTLRATGRTDNAIIVQRGIRTKWHRDGKGQGHHQGWKIREQRETESFGSSHIGIRSKFCQNAGKNLSIFRNSENSRTSQNFLERSAKSREKIIKIGSNFDENCLSMKIFYRNSNKTRNKFDEVLRIF